MEYTCSGRVIMANEEYRKQSSTVSMPVWFLVTLCLLVLGLTGCNAADDVQGSAGSTTADSAVMTIDGCNIEPNARCKAADLSGANLSGANLLEATLEKANLSGANLSGANLKDADLRHTDLTAADLTDADLSGARLSYADVRGANLADADLSGTILWMANLKDADVTGTKYNADTQWHEIGGVPFDPVAAGAVLVED